MATLPLESEHIKWLRTVRVTVCLNVLCIHNAVNHMQPGDEVVRPFVHCPFNETTIGADATCQNAEYAP